MLHYINTRDTTGQWDQLFSEEEIDKILHICKSLETDRGHLGLVRNEESTTSNIRDSKVGWLNRNSDNGWIFDRYDGAVQRLNSTLFNVDVDPLLQMQFTVYEDNGGHYDWHWDLNYTPDPSEPVAIKQRKISVVTQLNDPKEYDGGLLQVAPCGQIWNVDKGKGNTFMFLSFVNHKVTPVTRGVRYSLVAWYEGPDWK